jgi:hypothetical protein
VIRADWRIPLAEIITAEGAHLSRNATTVFVTPTEERSWIVAARDLSQRGINTVAVLLDSHSFGAPLSNEGMVNEVSTSGIFTYLVREGDDLAQALARPYAQAIKAVGRLRQAF